MTPHDRFMTSLPALVALLLVLISALPMSLMGLSLVPNVAWVATILFARMAPSTWPAWLAFVLGLLQDVVFATPLGAQATIALFLLLAMRARPARIGTPILRDAWFEGAVLLVAAQLALWVLMRWVQHAPLPPLPLLRAAVVNVVWFPILAHGAMWLVERLPK